MQQAFDVLHLLRINANSSSQQLKVAVFVLVLRSSNGLSVLLSRAVGTVFEQKQSNANSLEQQHRRHSNVLRLDHSHPLLQNNGYSQSPETGGVDSELTQ